MLPRSGVAPLSLSRVGQRLGRCTCRDAYRSGQQGLGFESSIGDSYWFLLTGFFLLVSSYWFLLTGFFLLVSSRSFKNNSDAVASYYDIIQVRRRS
jgi:hypothetical protein